MNWKPEAIERLKQYEAARDLIETFPKQIAEIDSAMTSIRSARIDAAPVQGGGNGREDMLLNCIEQKNELQRRLDHALFVVRSVERGLAVLGSEYRLILERFYIHHEKYAADRLAGDLCVDVTTVYRRKEEALRWFTIALYGCVES